MGDPQREFDTVAFHSSGSFLGISVRIHQLHGEAARNHGREARIIETGDRDLRHRTAEAMNHAVFVFKLKGLNDALGDDGSILFFRRFHNGLDDLFSGLFRWHFRRFGGFFGRFLGGLGDRFRGHFRQFCRGFDGFFHFRFRHFCRFLCRNNDILRRICCFLFGKGRKREQAEAHDDAQQHCKEFLHFFHAHFLLPFSIWTIMLKFALLLIFYHAAHRIARKMPEKGRGEREPASLKY